MSGENVTRFAVGGHLDESDPLHRSAMAQMDMLREPTPEQKAWLEAQACLMVATAVQTVGLRQVLKALDGLLVHVGAQLSEELGAKGGNPLDALPRVQTLMGLGKLSVHLEESFGLPNMVIRVPPELKGQVEEAYLKMREAERNASAKGS